LNKGTDEGAIEAVCAAVALGWQVAELYHERDAPRRGASPGAAGLRDLPGVASLPIAAVQQLRGEQIARGLSKIASLGSDDALEKLAADLTGQIDGASFDFAPDGVRATHEELLRLLTVSDFRFGKGYSLGRTLYELTRANQDVTELEAHLSEKHLNGLVAWCYDLKSVLPDHAGKAVGDSLRRWRSWARERPWTAPDGADFQKDLHRQGERWRALLTGEKRAVDLLTATTYVKAGEALIEDAARVAAGFVKRFWLVMLLAVLLLAGGLVALFAGGGSTASLFGGIASIATSLGITWKTATPTLKNVAETVWQPLWETEVGEAIVLAVTDPNVPRAPVTPPSAAQPLPIDRATDPRIARRAARQVWKRLDRGTRRQALAGRGGARRLYYRFGALWLGAGRALFLPHDRYMAQVQSSLEAGLAGKSLENGATGGDELYAAFGPNDLDWLSTVVQGLITRIEGKHPFNPKPAEKKIANDARLVLFGDWATGLPRARALSGRIEGALQEATGRQRHVIHLGDVYYSGLPDEYVRRFLNYWPVGEPAAPAPGAADAVDNAVYSWNLNGNHDMYSGGHGYFALVSGNPSLGVRAAGFSHQLGASFFRLYNDHWQIIGLDTAYVDNDLAPGQQHMLNQWVTKNPNLRTILLSHHQLGSSREQRHVSRGIFEQTQKVREPTQGSKYPIAAWFWGHEHRCFHFEPYKGVQVPFCLGNGGVPELLSPDFTLLALKDDVARVIGNLVRIVNPVRWKMPPPKVSWKPKKPSVDPQRLRWEQFGHVVLDFEGSSCTAEYRGEGCSEDGRGEVHSFTLS
jgi:hypothetical protein